MGISQSEPEAQGRGHDSVSVQDVQQMACGASEQRKYNISLRRRNNELNELTNYKREYLHRIKRIERIRLLQAKRTKEKSVKSDKSDVKKQSSCRLFHSMTFRQRKNSLIR